jgi:hypothetical protein
MGTSPLTCTEEEPSFDNSWLIIAFKGAIKITIEDFPACIISFQYNIENRVFVHKTKTA